MLVLTRRVGETLMIGDDIAVSIHAIEGRHVSIGINAPKTIPVHREEIYQKIQQQAADQEGQSQSASESPPP